MTAENIGLWKSNPTSRLGQSRTPAEAMFFGSLVVGFCATLFFYAAPRFDIGVSKLLYVAPHRFIGTGSILVDTLRTAFTCLFCCVCAFAVIGCVFSLSRRKRWLTLTSRQWLYLVVCLLVGPLAVTNLGFKDHWGRPRPMSVTEFGGPKAYDPPLTPSDQCNKNCSFFSGEASSIYIVCFAAAFLFPAEAALWTTAGIALGSIAGFIRMIEGGHFLSDVVFAGVFMALVASAIDMLFTAVARDPS